MVSVVSGQTNTTVNLSTQARNPDFSSMPFTRPVTVGTSLPATCLVGQLFFNSSAAAGNNLYDCISANTWNPVASSLTLPLSTANGGNGNSTPGLVAGTNVTISGSWPNQTVNGAASAVGIGSALPSTCTVGQLFFNNSAAAGSNLFGCTATNTYTMVGGATLTSPLPIASGGTGTATPGLIAGTNVTLSGSWPNQTVNGTASSISVGSSLPSTCTVGQLFFNNAAAAGSNLYGCTATNTYTVVGGATLTSPLPVANGGTGTAAPSLVAGTNVTISGSWPNQTVNGAAASVSIGSSLPSTCTVGQLFFNNSAAAGSNLYGCTATNTYTVVGGATLTSPLPIANGGSGTATPSLVAGTNVTISGSWPNQTVNGAASSVGVGSSLPSNCTVGQLFFNNSAAAGSNLYGCTATNTYTVVGGATLTSPLPIANGGSGTATPSLVAGNNVTISGSWPNQTVNGTASAVGIGSSLPSTCTVGQLFFNNSAAAGSNLYGCNATNTYTVVGGATLTSPLPIANGGSGTATPSLIAGTNVTISGSWPNQTVNGTASAVGIGSSLPSTCTVGQLFFNNSAAAGSNLYGCTAANTYTVVGAATLTSPLPVANGGNGTATPSLVAGTNVTISGSWPNQTINGAGSSVGVGSSLPSTCTVGQLFFNNSAAAGSNLYGCTSANTYTVVGAATLTSPLPIANGGTGTATPSLLAGTNVTISGTWPNQTVNASGTGGTSGNATSIQGASVSATAPVGNQALIYNGTSSAYIPTSIYTLQNGLGTATAGATNLQVNVAMGVRAMTATTDTIASTDCGGLVTYNNTGAVSVALPQAGFAGNFAAGCPVTVHNYGAGAVTITPSGSTIGGVTSQAVSQNKGCLIVSDGTNWQLGSCN